MKIKEPAAMDYQRGQKGGPTPLLRFPAHRQSAEWERKLLREIATLHKGRGLSKSEISIEGRQRCVRYGQLYTIYGEVIDEVVSATNLPASALFLSKKNDVILPASGETKTDITTASCVIHDGIALGSDLNIVRTGENGVFLSYYFNGALKKTIAKLAQGDAVVHLYQSQLEQLSIPLPPPGEQREIADCLFSIDELISAESLKLSVRKTHKKGLLQQLFTADRETTPRLRFPEFRDAGEWLSIRLGKGFEISSGGTPDRSKKEYWNGTIPWVTTSLLNNSHISTVEEYISEEGLRSSSAKTFPCGTVLIAMYGQGKTRGKVSILDCEAATNQACAAIFPSKNILPDFVFMNLGNRYEELRSLSNPGGQENLSLTLIKELEIRYPANLEEQKRITACISMLEEQISGQIRRIELLKTHKRGLMQQLFPALDEVQA